jgi:iron complex transport system permease protein
MTTTNSEDTAISSGRVILNRSRRPMHRRTRIVALVLAIAAVVLAVVALGSGDYPLSVPEVLHALFVRDGSFEGTIVTEWRLPRVLAALAFGAALGVSGALFQSLTGNPLGSPDIIGFSTGSYTGALIAITVVGDTYLSTSAGALVGGLTTALVVYLLAYRRGVQGFRLIIVGIAITALLTGVNTYLLLRASVEVAMSASIWGSGSISLVGWDQAVPAMGVLVVLAPLVILLSRPLRQLELGDDAAQAHGVRTEPARLAILVVGVALIATVTAVAGPIAFIALAAPQIAQRLGRSAGLPLVGSALTGAVLLLLADFIAQHLFPGGPVPVGIVTVCIGGLYLIWLLAADRKSSSM